MALFYATLKFTNGSSGGHITPPLIYDVRPERESMKEITESYRRIGDPDDRFDIEFWQSQGDQAIFEAALEMVLDYLALRYGYVDQPRLQRTVEYFGKA